MDLTDLTDEELDQQRIDVLIEQERRANLAAIPAQITALARTFCDGGGNDALLTAALEEATRNG